MPNTALITGASSGLGAEFARIHAARGGDVIITARREAELMELKAELEAKHSINAHVVALDLGAGDGAKKLYEACQSIGADIKVLINNAGFGGHGLHIERELDAELAMISLNINALVSLTHMVAADMVKSGGGKILNVGSTGRLHSGSKSSGLLLPPKPSSIPSVRRLTRSCEARA